MDFGGKPFHRSVSALFPATDAFRTSTRRGIITQTGSSVKKKFEISHNFAKYSAFYR
jgi:hypothetical protein